MYLLDTCVLLWLAGGARSSISPAVIRTIQENPEALFVSGISGLEIGLKAGSGKLSLPVDAATWFEQAVSHHGIHEIPVDGSLAARSTLLPPIHRDPCDRVIVATAIRHDLTVLTPDKLISSYPGVKTLW